VRENATTSSVRFEPIRPASRASVVAGVVLGPLLWLAALAVAAWFFEYSWAIAVGLAVTVASFVLALIVLALIWRGRVRQEERYVDGS
jgi:ABC-type transport system involved in Fe-S cluster assembly fused permease/ATPase subunit